MASSLIVEVVKLGKLDKHPNADTLSIATVKGWQCIVKDGEFKEGDLAIYVPIDAVLPDKLIEDYGLSYVKPGERIRTVKLRSFISQGLLLPLPPGVNWKEGYDVAEELGITKWEPPLPKFQFGGSPVRQNPNFSKFSSIENIKNFPSVFAGLQDVVITEKIHGTNSRYGNVKCHINPNDPIGETENPLSEYEYVCGSHNVQLIGRNSPNAYQVNGQNVYVMIGEKFNIKNILPPDHELFGEIFGPGIQDLTYNQKEVTVAFFALKVNGRYIPYDDFVDFCTKHNLPMTPLLYRGPWRDDLLEKYTTGKSVIAPNQIREGCVITDATEKQHPQMERAILKSISPDYLLRKNGTEYH